MRLFPTKESKDGFSKLLYDVAKIILAMLVLQPMLKGDIDNFRLTVGVFTFTLLSIAGYLVDRRRL